MTVQSFPNLHLSVYLDDKKNLRFQLVNGGNVPAYDIDIFFFIIVSESDISLSELFKKYLDKDYKKLDINATTDGFYYLRDRVIYRIANPQSEVVAKVRTPINPDQMYVFIQYRNIFGENYSQKYWITQALDPELNEKNLKLSLLEPIPIIKSSRLEMDLHAFSSGDFNTISPTRLVSTDGKKLQGILKDVVEMMVHSISVGQLKQKGTPEWYDKEDRGTWKRIK